MKIVLMTITINRDYSKSYNYKEFNNIKRFSYTCRGTGMNTELSFIDENNLNYCFPNFYISGRNESENNWEANFIDSIIFNKSESLVFYRYE